MTEQLNCTEHIHTTHITYTHHLNTHHTHILTIHMYHTHTPYIPHTYHTHTTYAYHTHYMYTIHIYTSHTHTTHIHISHTYYIHTPCNTQKNPPPRPRPARNQQQSGLYSLQNIRVTMKSWRSDKESTCQCGGCKRLRFDLLEKEMVIRSSILAWTIPRTEEPHRLQAMGSQRDRHDCTRRHHCEVVYIVESGWNSDPTRALTVQLCWMASTNPQRPVAVCTSHAGACGL